MHGNEMSVHAQARYESLLREAEAERLIRNGRPVRQALLGPFRLLVALILGRH